MGTILIISVGGVATATLINYVNVGTKGNPTKIRNIKQKKSIIRNEEMASKLVYGYSTF